MIFIILFFALILALVYFYKSIQKPFLAIILIPLGSYLGQLGRLFENQPIPLTMFQIFLFIGFYIFLLHKIVKHDGKLRFIGLEIEWLIFFSLIFFSLIYSPNRLDGLFYATRFLVLVLMIYLIYNVIITEKEIYKVLIAIVLMSIFLGFLSVSEGMKTENLIWNVVSMGRKLEGRATVNVKDPNIFANHFLLPIYFLISTILIKGNEKKNKLLSLIILPLLFLGIASTFSRSAWVALGSGFLLIPAILRKYKIYFFLIVGIILIVLFIPKNNFFVENVVQRFLDIFQGTKDDSSRTRLLLGIASLHMIFDSYLLGVGFRGFLNYVPQYVSVQQTIGVVEPHNVLYTVFAELGLLGFLLYLWIIIKMVYTAINNYKLSSNPMETTLSLTFLLTFISYFIFYQFYGGGLVDNNWWIVSALIFSLNRSITQKNSMESLVRRKINNDREIIF